MRCCFYAWNYRAKSAWFYVLLANKKLTFQSNSSHTNSMWSKSIDCAGKDFIWKTCCSSVSLMHLWQIYLYNWVVILHETNPWQSPFQMESLMLQYAMSAVLIQYTLHLVQLARASHTITVISPCASVGVIQGVAALSSTRRSYLTQKFRMEFIPLLYCPVLVDWSLLTSFCFLNGGFLTAIQP